MTKEFKPLEWDDKEITNPPPEERNELLEVLSEMVRKGEPVNMAEALAVAEYQTRLRKAREAKESKTLWGRFKAFFKRNK